MPAYTYRAVSTGDGSLSLFSEEYSEMMHSDSGAYEESLLKHVYPSRVLARTEATTVFDIGFGLGYNALALALEWQKQHPAHPA